METQNSEIDIIELLVKIVKFTKQYFIFFIILIIVGAIFGFLTNKNQTIYTSEMIGTTDLFTDYYSESQNEIIYEKASQTIVDAIFFLNKTDITKELDIENKINSISAVIIKDDNSQVTENLKISVVLTEKMDLSILDEKINNYLSENKYIKSKFEEQKLQNLALINKINSEISEIDSLQNLIISKKITNNQIVYEEDNPVICLFEKKLALEKKNKNNNPLVTITQFYPAKEKTSDNKINIIITSIIFLILGVLIALIRELLKISKNA